MTKNVHSSFVVVIIAIMVYNTCSFAEAKSCSINGVVLDQSTRSPVANANVVVLNTDVGAATDLKGKFEIHGLKPAVYNLKASALGYIADIKSEVLIKPGRSTELEFLIEPTVIEGEEAVVVAGFFRPKPDLVTSARTLRYEEVRRAPGSAEDVQRAIQALPGIAASNDQTNEIIVRGGSPTENLLIVDGIEIDNINHFPEQASSGGPIGLINPEFLREVTFASGGFSARYGDRLSSVLDLNLREGSRERFTGQLALSMAGIGANCEGGFADKKGSYLVSYRKSYLEIVKDAIGLTATPIYWDSQLKVTYDLTPKDKLSLIGLYGNDRIEIEQEEADAWSRGAEAFKATGSTSALGGKWRRIWGNGYTDITLAMTEIKYKYDVYEVNKDAADNVIKRQFYKAISTETTNQIHINRTQKILDKDELSLGLSLKPISFSHDFWLEEDTTAYDINSDDITDTTVYRPEMDIDESTISLKYGGFVQYRWRPLNNLTIIGGLRLDGFQYAAEFATRSIRVVNDGSL